MRLVTIRTPDGTRAGRIDGDDVVVLDHADVRAVLTTGSDWADRVAAADGPRQPFGDVDLAPLVPQPEKIICLGLNYVAHIREMGRELPEHPTLFAKYSRALIGARDPIVLPSVSSQVDWEAELGVIVGREVRHADEAEATAAIAGFTVVNDVTARDWQSRTIEFLQGKTFEGTTPLGPALVTPDELPGGGRDLLLRCEVDGEVVQEARTSDLLFPPAAIITYVSTILTLVPGDVIATGTPAGVGAGRVPPMFLRPGQLVRTTVEGVGELVNRCIEEPPAGATSTR